MGLTTDNWAWSFRMFQVGGKQSKIAVKSMNPTPEIQAPYPATLEAPRKDLLSSKMPSATPHAPARPPGAHQSAVRDDAGLSGTPPERVRWGGGLQGFGIFSCLSSCPKISGMC